jgi:transposase
MRHAPNVLQPGIRHEIKMRLRERDAIVRKPEAKQNVLFSYKSIEDRIPEKHPIRTLKKLVDQALDCLDDDFEKLYSNVGRPSIPPEQLIRALLVQVFFSIRSERQLVEQLDYNMLFRWFVGLNPDDPIWDHSTFTKNRDRILEGEICLRFFREVLGIAKNEGLVSDEHFTVDGTIIEAWASHKSFQPKSNDDDDDSNPGSQKNPDINYQGQKRKNDTHESKSDPDARLYRKSKRTGAQLCYLGHALMENRNGLAVDSRVTHAVGKAEEQAAQSMASAIKGTRRITLGADKGYDSNELLSKLRNMNVTPHIAKNDHERRTSSIDQRTLRHDGYNVSQKKRKLVEQIFGWAKTVGCLRKVKHRGIDLLQSITTLNFAAYNLIRIRNLTMA